jgi:hypothetical protein
MIHFGTNGQAAPTLTTARSVGTKLIVYDSFVASSQADYAIGWMTDYMWFSSATTSKGFRWYGGATLAATLTGAGALTLVGALQTTALTVTTGDITLSAENKKISAASGLTLEQVGGVGTSDTYGTTRLHLQNRVGVNGAMFEQAGSVDLVDFVFKGLSNQRNIRYENRASPTSFVSNPEFQIGSAGSMNCVIADTILAIKSNFRMYGSSSGYVQFSPASAVTTYTLTFPSAQGSYNALLVNDGSGGLSWSTTITLSSLTLSTALVATSGGTGQSSYTLGDLLYSSASNTLSKLSGNTTTTKKFLRQTGNGSVSAAPAWDTIVGTDLTAITISGSCSYLSYSNGTFTSNYNFDQNLTTASSPTFASIIAKNSGLKIEQSTDSGNYLWSSVHENGNGIISYAGSGALYMSAGGSYNLILGSTGTTMELPLTISSSSPQITLSNGTSNWIKFANNGVAAPTVTTTRSIGTKLLLYDSFSNGVSADYAIGIEGGSIWFGVPTVGSHSFKWYGAATLAATLTGAGALTLSSTLSCATSITLSGTAINTTVWGYLAVINQNLATSATPTFESMYITKSSLPFVMLTQGADIGVIALSAGADNWLTGSVSGDVCLRSTTKNVNIGTYANYSINFVINNIQKGVWSSSGLNIVGTLTCDTSLTIDSVSIGATALEYCNDINQQLTTSSTPTFSTLTLSGTSPNLTFSNATSNMIQFGTNGLAAPILTTARSVGTKLILRDSFVDATYADYAIGVENGSTWFSVPTVGSHSFKWYGAATLAATLTGAGALTLVSTLACATSITLSGTAINTTVWGYLAVADTALSTAGIRSLFSASDSLGNLTYSAGAYSFVGWPTFNSIELRWDGGTPLIDFSDDTVSDWKVRLQYSGTNFYFFNDNPAGSFEFNKTVNVNSTLTCDTSFTIDAVSIGATALEYCNDINQQLTTTSTPTFSNIILNGAAGSNGQIYLNNGTSNMIICNGNGSAAPSYTRSVGSRFVLSATANGSTLVDYAIGSNSWNMWFSVGESIATFKWYAGTTDIMTLSGSGVLSGATWQGATVGATYGGTGQSTYTLGDLLYSSASNTLSKLSGNTTTTKKFLSQTGNGSVSAAPAWNTIVGTDLTAISISGTCSYLSYSNGTFTSNYNFSQNLTAADAPSFVGLEVRWNGGTPYIDFTNDDTYDHDFRIIYNGTNLAFENKSGGGGYTFDSTVTVSAASPQISLSNGTSNWILFGSAGYAAPTITTTRSTGTRLLLYDSFSNGVSADYAIGIEGGAMWYCIPTSSHTFKWYAGATNIQGLSGSGAFTKNLKVSNSDTWTYLERTSVGDNRLSMYDTTNGGIIIYGQSTEFYLKRASNTGELHGTQNLTFTFDAVVNVKQASPFLVVESTSAGGSAHLKIWNSADNGGSGRGWFIYHDGTYNILRFSTHTAGELMYLGTDKFVISGVYLEVTNGRIDLSNGTSNLINFKTAGSAVPAFTSRSAGTKLVLYDSLSGSAVDYALGITTDVFWSSVATTSKSFKWYGGTTLAATLTGGGLFTLVGGLVLPNADGGTAATMDHYEEYSASASVSGGSFTNPQTFNIKLVRVGNVVTFTADELKVAASGTSNYYATGFNVILARLAPANPIYIPIRVRNNDAGQLGMLYIGNDTSFSIYFNIDGTTNNTNSGNCGHYAFSVSYSI